MIMLVTFDDWDKVDSLIFLVYGNIVVDNSILKSFEYG